MKIKVLLGYCTYFTSLITMTPLTLTAAAAPANRIHPESFTSAIDAFQAKEYQVAKQFINGILQRASRVELIRMHDSTQFRQIIEGMSNHDFYVLLLQEINAILAQHPVPSRHTITRQPEQALSLQDNKTNFELNDFDDFILGHIGSFLPDRDLAHLMQVSKRFHNPNGPLATELFKHREGTAGYWQRHFRTENIARKQLLEKSYAMDEAPKASITLSAYASCGNIQLGVFATQSNEYQLFDLQRGELLKTFTLSPDQDVCSIAFSHDGKLIALASSALGNHSSLITLWDWQTDTATPITIEASNIHAINFSPINRDILACKEGSTGSILLYDLKKKTIIQTIRTNLPVSYNKIIFSPDGTLLVYAIDETEIAVWNIEQSVIVKTFKDRNNVIGHGRLSFSPNGKILACAYPDDAQHKKQVALWDLVNDKTLEPIRFPVTDHDDASIDAIAFSPIDNRLIACMDRHRIYLWDIVEQRQIYEFWYGDYSCSVRFTTDGKLLITIDTLNRVVCIWGPKDILDNTPKK